MKSIIITVLILSGFVCQAEENIFPELSKYYSPTIKGDTLYIKGKIDSHIYDYISIEYKAMAKVKYVSLNSFGGSHDWGLEIGQKIQQLGKITILKSGNVCASACVYIFGSGKERLMSKDTWLGVHGARLGAGYNSSFLGLCFVHAETGHVFKENKSGCKDFLQSWYDISLKATNKAFDLIEKAGVSAELRTYYFSLDDNPNWYEQVNILKKPDLVIDSEMSLKYSLATGIK